MIVSCPNCGKKYKIAEEKLGGKAKRFRCKQCKEVFIIHPPKEEAEVDSSSVSSIDERAARFARVLASDMLIYNKDAVETGLKDGSLLEALAGEIERSWQLWKNRFPEDAESNLGVKVFRDSLKDIIADGNDLFDDWKPEA